MKDEEFKEKLAQVAEWEIPDVNSGGNFKSLKKRGRKTKEKQFQEEHEQQFLEMFGGKNPTVYPIVTKVKVVGCMCEDCGRFCENGRKTEKKVYPTNRPHWRERCLTCDLNKNPYTGKFDLSNKDASAYWSNWLKIANQKSYVHKKTIRINTEQNKDD